MIGGVNYMSNFNNAILFVLGNEGGYSNDKNDKGGATNFGISTRFLKQIDKDVDGNGHVNKKDVEALTKDASIELYREYFWDYYRLGELRDLLISRKALDLFVNMRGKAAAKILQKACNRCGATLKIDGILGTRSINSINSLSLFGITREQLLAEIRIGQADLYKAIVKANKTQSKFLKGWLARAAR